MSKGIKGTVITKKTELFEMSSVSSRWVRHPALVLLRVTALGVHLAVGFKYCCQRETSAVIGA